MDILIEFDFIDGMEYYSWANSSIDLNGKQYANLIANIGNFSENMGDNKSFEVSDITIECYDYDNHFRYILNSETNRFICGRDVNIKLVDGTLLQKMTIQTWSLSPFRISFICSNKIDSQDFTEKIDKVKWPYAVDGVVGWSVPLIYNTVALSKAPIVDNRWSNDNTIPHYNFLLSKTEIGTITRVEVPTHGVVDPSLYSIVNNDGYWYLDCPYNDYLDEGECAWVDMQTTQSYDPVDIIKDILDTRFNIVSIASNTTFKSYLSDKGYSASNTHFVLDTSFTAKDLLTQFCVSFECNYRFNMNGEIEFVPIDIDDVQTETVLRQEEILSFGELQYDPQTVKNRIRYHYNRDYKEDKYLGYGEYNEEHQDQWGVSVEEVEFPFLAESVQAEFTAQLIAQLNREPRGNVQVTLSLDLGFNLQTGDLIKIYHQYSRKPDYPVLYQVVRRNLDFNNETITLDLVDYDYLVFPGYLMTEGESSEAILLEDGGYIILE